MTRNFWWGQKGDERKIAWKAWDDLCCPKNEGGLGFRNISLFNQALLAKQCWRIVQRPDSLVARLLKGKYHPRSEFLKASAGSRPSFVWRSLLHGRSLLHKGLRWRVGDGASIKCWKDPWLPTSGTFLPAGINRNLLEDAKVADLVDPELHAWKMQLVDSLFLPHEVSAIISIPLSRLDTSDRLLWHHDPKGQYSVKSGYKFAFKEWYLNKHIPAGASSSWGAIHWKPLWKVALPPRVKIFAWRAASGCLAIGDNLRKRGVTDGLCPVCRGCCETDKHCFFECDWALRVWSNLDGGLNWVRKSTPSMKHLLIDILGADPHYAARFIAVMWCIWTARNRAIFDNAPIIISRVWIEANSLVEEHHKVTETCRGLRSSELAQVAWQPPNPSYLKINVDAAFLEHGSATGVLARNHEGKIIHAASVYMGRLTGAEEAELRAILAGVQVAHKLHFQNIIMESDSILAIHRIESEDGDLSSLGLIAEEIRSYMSMFDACSIKFVRRMGNVPAHLLAKIAMGTLSSTEWGDNPPSTYCNFC